MTINYEELHGKKQKLWNTDSWQQFFRKHATFRVICLTCSTKIIQKRDTLRRQVEEARGMVLKRTKREKRKTTPI